MLNKSLCYFLIFVLLGILLYMIYNKNILKALMIPTTALVVHGGQLGLWRCGKGNKPCENESGPFLTEEFCNKACKFIKSSKFQKYVNNMMKNLNPVIPQAFLETIDEKKNHAEYNKFYDFTRNEELLAKTATLNMHFIIIPSIVDLILNDPDRKKPVASIVKYKIHAVRLMVINSKPPNTELHARLNNSKIKYIFNNNSDAYQNRIKPIYDALESSNVFISTDRKINYILRLSNDEINNISREKLKEIFDNDMDNEQIVIEDEIGRAHV